MDRGNFLKILALTTASTFVGRKSGLIKAAEKDNPKGVRTQEAFVEQPVTAIVIGAGSRGTTYAGYAAQYPKSFKIVGVSDIKQERKLSMASKYEIPEQNQFNDWSEVFKKKKFADTVIISTPDNLHYKPCIKALEMGYDVLLEKPIAQTAQECLDIAIQAKKYDRIVAVCHVLRYAPYFIALKAAIDSGKIGEVVSLQHFEAVRYHHFAHSYVRGNWHDSKQTTPVILAKSCHDLDLIRWISNEECEQVSALGDLKLFKVENAPKGSAERCLNCSVENQCPYSALKIYLNDRRYLYVFDLPEDKSKHEEFLLEKLRTTDYGKCVYRCDNDQCDHYAMAMKFKGGLTAGFNMEAFTSYSGRYTRIMGTKGDIVGDMKTFTVTDFLTAKQSVWNEDISTLPGYSSHAGGDWGIVKDFVLAVSNHDEKYLSCTLDVSVESHNIAFSAEESRLNNKVVNI